MRHSFLSLWMQTALLALEAQLVINLRMMRLFAGGATAEAETARMLSEKTTAAMAAGMDAAVGVATGKSSAAIAHKTLRGYRTRVRANSRRLTKR